MSHATLTMIGLYRYDPTIFDEMTLPTGIDKDLAINSILMRCGEQEVVYPDPNFLKSAIGVWSDKHYFTFDKWKKALDEEFNPLYNYDRHEEYTDNRVVNENEKNQNVNSELGSDKRKSDSVSNGSTSNSSTQNDNTSAFDSTGYQPKEQTINNGNGTTNDLTQSESESQTATNATMQSDKNRNMGEVMRHDAHLYGNIGVTTSVQMLKEYVGFYKDFNLYEQIAGLFADDFVIGIF